MTGYRKLIIGLVSIGIVALKSDITLTQAETIKGLVGVLVAGNALEHVGGAISEVVKNRRRTATGSAGNTRSAAAD